MLNKPLQFHSMILKNLGAVIVNAILINYRESASRALVIVRFRGSEMP